MHYFILTCGHIGEYCERCNCRTIDFVVNSAYEKLENRFAKCGDRMVKSRWDLPGFVYQPDKDFDLYFNGQRNKVMNSGKQIIFTKKSLKENERKETDNE